VKSPAVEAMEIASKIWGHHHASVALNRRIPELLVADAIIS